MLYGVCAGSGQVVAVRQSQLIWAAGSNGRYSCIGPPLYSTTVEQQCGCMWHLHLWEACKSGLYAYSLTLRSCLKRLVGGAAAPCSCAWLHGSVPRDSLPPECWQFAE